MVAVGPAAVSRLQRTGSTRWNSRQPDSLTTFEGDNSLARSRARRRSSRTQNSPITGSPTFEHSPIHYSGSTVAQLFDEKGSHNPDSTSVALMAVDDSHAGTPLAPTSGVMAEAVPGSTPPPGTLKPTLDGAASRGLTQANNGVTAFRPRPHPNPAP
jgi:hypothetical protein